MVRKMEFKELFSLNLRKRGNFLNSAASMVTYMDKLSLKKQVEELIRVPISIINSTANGNTNILMAD